MLGETERKLVGLFKQFMEKCIVPTIRNFGTVMTDWQSFSGLLTQEPLDYLKLQSFLDVKTSGVRMFPATNFPKKDDKDLKTTGGFLKKKEDIPTTVESPLPEPPGTYSFNSNKTFGGEKARLNMYPLKPTTSTGQPSLKDDKLPSQTSSTSADKILNNLQSLLKTLSDNQQRFEQTASSMGGTMGGGTSGPSAFKYEEKKYY